MPRQVNSLSSSSSSSSKPVSPWRKVNVLAIYTKSNHEYRLFDPTAVVHNADWLDLNTFPPVEDALPRTKSPQHLGKMASQWRQFNVLAMLLDHTTNTHFLSPPQWHTVLTGFSRIAVHPVRTALIQYKWPEHWLALMAKPVFQVLRSLMHLGRSSLMGESVSRWSQSALFTITVGSENLYLWFNSVSMARPLTCLYGTTGFPGVDVPSGPW